MSNAKRIQKKATKLESRCYIKILKIDPVLFEIKGQTHNEYEAMMLLGKIIKS